MPDKPKVGFYWCASCGGCEESVVDLAENILGVIEAVDIILWPVAMDFKKHDVEAMADESILVTMINGAIRTSEQEEMARLLRRKSKLIIAYGSCAHMGGIPGLANQFDREQILRFVYDDSPSTENPEKVRPAAGAQTERLYGNPARIPGMVRTLDQVIDVDYYLPGCPPVPKLLKHALDTLLSGNLPPKGTVLAPDVALCEECPKKETKPSDLLFTEFKRPHQKMLDPGHLPSRAGSRLHGPGNPGGMRRTVPLRQHALHRLFWAYITGQGSGRKDPRGDCLVCQSHKGRRDCRDPRDDSRSGGHVLPLRTSRLVAQAQTYENELTE